MRTEIPVAIACISGLIIVLAHFFDIGPLTMAAGILPDWGVLVAAFAIVLSAVSLIVVHTRRLSNQREESWNKAMSLITIGLFFATAITGVISRQHVGFNWLYDHIMMPLGVTFSSMSMFFMVTASYRAFRAKSLESALFLGAGLIILLGNAPIVEAYVDWFAKASGWIMATPNMAAQRGLLIGAGIGAVQTGLRVICGLDRGYL